MRLNLFALMLFPMFSILTAPCQAQVDEDFFEARVRPILVQKCLSCHGPDQQEGDLRLDSAASLKAGGQQGSVIHPDAWDQSLLLQVISYESDLQMPPDGKLDDTSLTHLRQWVQAGAPWPEQTKALGQSLDDRRVAERQSHWALQPITQPNVPEVSDPLWKTNPIDAFVAAKLEAHGLAPSLPADDRTLVRRLYFDLLGLPATTEDVRNHIDNPSPQRWSERIDQLLSRPQYGERWGRYWLDVARYADTQGYAFARDRRYPHAYTYRDYVVQSFLEDKPYDQFVMEQLAADQMDLGDDNSELAALGFITVGRRFINHHDIIDDRIDVVTRGLMGLTVSCARCHDHKYDAIPTKDYYSLYGVFASTVEPEVKPVFGPLQAVQQRQAFENRQRELQGDLDQFRNAKTEEIKQHTRERLQDYLLATFYPPEGMNLDQVDQRVSLQSDSLRPRMVRRWRDRLHHYQNARSPEMAVFQPFAPLMALPEDRFAEAATVQIAIWKSLATPEVSIIIPEALQDIAWNRDPMLPMIIDRLESQALQSRAQVAQFYADLIREVWKTFEDHGANDQAVLQVEVPLRLIIELKRKPDSPWNLPATEVGLYLTDSDYPALQEKENALNQHNASAPPELPRAMAVHDSGNLFQPYVFVRGSDGNRGPDVPRRYLAILTEEQPEPFPSDVSGRLQLAQNIVADENPLTARVIANRVWMHHFGSPLVDTPSDFGIRCETPEHVQLLNYLAWYLRDQKWSIKALHRLILNSRTWQQQSGNREEAYAKDPENRWYWRMNRRRQDWESLRDSLFAVAGQLDLTVGGPAIDMYRSQPSNRRSIYGTIDRQDLPNLLRSFDFASPDSSAAKRPQTTVPQQALFLMNGTMAAELSQKLLQQESVPGLDQPDQRLAWVFDRIYLREMTGDEYQTCRQFIDQVELPTDGENLEQRQQQARQKRWEMLVQAMMMSNEFCFID